MNKINFLLTISICYQEKWLWALIKWSPKRKCFDLLPNSLNTFLKEMYRDQSGEFLSGYWSLKSWRDLGSISSFKTEVCSTSVLLIIIFSFFRFIYIFFIFVLGYFWFYRSLAYITLLYVFWLLLLITSQYQLVLCAQLIGFLLYYYYYRILSTDKNVGTT